MTRSESPGSRSAGRRGGGLALVVALLMGTGCAGFFAAREGQGALERGDYDRAIEQLEQATREAPDNAEYRALLERARRGAATRKLEEARAWRAKGDLNQALEACRVALEYDSGLQEAQALRAYTLKELVAARAQVEGVRMALQTRQHEVALRALEVLQPLAPTFPELPELRKQAQVQAEGARLVREAEALVAAGRPGEALPLYEQAVGLDASHEAAVAGLRKAQELEAARLHAEAEAKRQQRQLGSAILLLERAAAVCAPEAACRAELQGKAQAVRRELAQRLRQLGLQARQQGLAGLEWARQRAANLLLPAAERQAEPELEPALRLRVGVVVEGSEEMVDPLRVQLRNWLERYKGAGRVERTEAPGDLLLHVAAGPAQFETVRQRVERLTRRYVQRMESVPNPRWHELQEESRTKVLELQSTEGALVRVQLRRVEAEGAVREGEAGLADAKRQQQDLLGQARVVELQAVERRKDREQARQELTEAQQKLAQLVNGKPTPEQVKEAQGQVQQRQAAWEEAQKKVALLEEQVQSLKRQGEQLVERAQQELAGRKQARDLAVSEVARLEEQQQRVEAELQQARKALGQTPLQVRQPVEGDYSYEERHWELRGRAEGQLRVSGLAWDGGLAPALRRPVRVGLEPRGQQEERVVRLSAALTEQDFERDGHRVAGVPELVIPTKALKFPPAYELQWRLAEQCVAQVRATLEDVLRYHGERFVRAARAETDEAALDAWVLAHAAQAQLRSAEQKKAAAAQLWEALGLRVPPAAPEEGVDLARLDGI
jgi:hypothetical protein